MKKQNSFQIILLFFFSLFSTMHIASQNACDCTFDIDIDITGQCKFALSKTRIGVPNCQNSYIVVNDSNPKNRDTIDEPGIFIYTLLHTDGSRICGGWVKVRSTDKPVLDSVHYLKDTLIYTKIYDYLRNVASAGKLGTYESPFYIPFKMDNKGQLLEAFLDTIPNVGVPFFSSACKLADCTLKLSFTDDITYSNCANLQKNPLYATIKRTWTVEDCNGNTNSTVQFIYFKRPTATDFIWNFNKISERNLNLSYGECTIDPRLIPINAVFPIAKETKLRINDFRMDFTLRHTTKYDTVCNGKGLNVTRRFTITDDCTNNIIDSFRITLQPNGDVSKWASIPTTHQVLDMGPYCTLPYSSYTPFLINTFRLAVNPPCKPRLIQIEIQQLDINNFNEDKWIEAYKNSSGYYLLTGGKYRLLVSMIDSCNNIHLESIPFQMISTAEEVNPPCLTSFDVKLESNGQKISKTALIPAFQFPNCSNFALAVRRIIAPGCINNYLNNLDYDLDKDGNVLEHFQGISSGKFEGHYYTPWMNYIELFRCDDNNSIHYEAQYRSATGQNFSYICSNTIHLIQQTNLHLYFDENILFTHKTACIPLIAEGFRGLSATEFSVKFDPDLLRFEKAKFHPTLGVGEFIFRSNNQPNVLWFSWGEWREQPIFLQEKTTLFELCFTPLTTGKGRIWIDTTNRMEFISPYLPFKFRISPGDIEVWEEGEYSSPIKELSNDSLKIKVSQENKLIKLFPNPSSDKVFVTLPTVIPQEGVLRVVDIYGKVWLKKELNTNEKSLSIQGLNPGLYFVEIQVGEKHWTERLIVLNP